MFVPNGRPPARSAPTAGRRRPCHPAGRRPTSTATRQGSTGLLAAEDPVGYDTGPADTAEGPVVGYTDPADTTGERVDGDPHGAGAWGWPVGGAPRATEARARLERCATTPGSPLGAAVGALGNAVDSLAATATLDTTVAIPGPAGNTEESEGGPGGMADPGLPGEHVDLVGDALVAVVHLRARLDACELALLADFDRRGGHRADGAVTVSSWLAGRTGTDYAAAARQTTTARRLGALPRLAGHLAAGDITLAHVTAVTDRCVPARAERFSDAEPILADLAAGNPPRHVRHAVRRLLDASDPDAADRPDAPGGDPLRELRLSTGFQGRGQLDATLDPLTREALTVLLDAFDTPDPADTPARQRRTPSQRRHDAFAAMLHTLLAQPGLPTVQGARPQILITIDLAALLGLPPDHPAADITLADLAAWLGIDLPGLVDTDTDTDTDHSPDTDTDAEHGPDDTEADGDASIDETDDTHGTMADDATADAADPPGAGAAGGPDPATADAADTAGADGADAARADGAIGPDPGAARGVGTDAGEAGAPGQPAGSDQGATGPATDPDTGTSARVSGASGADPPGPAGPPPARPPPRRPPRFGSGVPVSPTTVRGLVPAATIMAVLTLGPWRAVNVGEKHRTLPAWLRTVLAAFHVHCRGPYCDRPASWTEAHHITPWATARTTDLNDTLPCCPGHHDLFDEGWTATLDHTTGNVTWTSPTGRVIVVPPPTPWPFG